MFKKYITMLFAFLVPIVRNAIVQSAADEVAKWAVGEDRAFRQRRIRDINRRRRDLITSFDRYQPPASMREATMRVGRSVREADEFSAMHREGRYPWGSSPDEPEQGYHDVIMVAFDLAGPNAKNVHEWLHDQLPAGDETYGEKEEIRLDSWWVANDERYDRSDCDSAVFVTMGKQAEARELLRKHGLLN